MSWIEQAAEEHLSDMRSYSTKKEAYRKSLTTVADRVGIDGVQELGQFILDRVRKGRPPAADVVRKEGIRICHRHDSKAIGTYLAR